MDELGWANLEGVEEGDVLVLSWNSDISNFEWIPQAECEWVYTEMLQYECAYSDDMVAIWTVIAVIVAIMFIWGWQTLCRKVNRGGGST